MSDFLLAAGPPGAIAGKGTATILSPELRFLNQGAAAKQRSAVGHRASPFGPSLLPMSPEYLAPMCPEWTGEGWCAWLDSYQRRFASEASARHVSPLR